MGRGRGFILGIGVVVALGGLLTSPALADPFPYELETEREAGVLGSSALMFGAGLLVDRNFTPLTAEEIAAHDPESVNWFDRSATDNWSPKADMASDILAYTLMVAPLSLMLTDEGSREPWSVGVMYLETMALQGSAIYLLKNVFSRSRPFVYNDDPGIPSSLKSSRTARRSFPSGHASNAFAAMVFTATVHEGLYPESSANGWVWGGCLTAAATTGYLRYAAGRHFPTDILAGAALGALAGYLVPKWHRIDPADPSRDPAAKSSPGMTFAVRLGF